MQMKSPHAYQHYAISIPKLSGGTGQAIRIAVQYKIPVLNMQRSEWDSAEKVIEQLRRILGL